ncbi:MAG TPA: hypothetical protein VFT58_03720, partial [Nitrososphaera sp.]|nr:hypothetical protein [Nitrososphaera sp.]
WYLRGLKLGTIAAGAEVDLETRVRVFLPEEENVATTPSNFSMARMIGGAIGDPLDPYFRERMGIQEVPLPPGFQP